MIIRLCSKLGHYIHLSIGQEIKKQDEVISEIKVSSQMFVMMKY